MIGIGVLVLSCSDECNKVEITGPVPRQGTIRVSTVTTGEDIDPDGYQIFRDGTPASNIGTQDTITLLVGTGDHQIELRDVAENCTVEDPNPRTVRVTEAATTSTTFNIECDWTTGFISLQTVTTGPDPDPDGYIYSSTHEEPPTQDRIGINETVEFEGVLPGSYQITLLDIASQCSVNDPGPLRSFDVEAGSVSEVTYIVECGVPAPGAWSRWPSGATDRDLYGVSFVDDTHGWAVGSQGAILSTDGTTWSPQTSRTTVDLRAVAFTDENNGTAVGLDNTILHTTNGGAIWGTVIIEGHANVDYWMVSMVGQNAWAGGWVSAFGGLGIIVSTDNGWSTWSVDTIPGFSPDDVLFLDANTGWIVGDDGSSPAIYWTTTGVGNWTAAQTIPDCFPTAVTFVDVNQGWAVGTKSGGETCAMYSSDGGKNWSDETSKLPGAPIGQANDVSFASTLVGTIVGATIYRTEDGGAIWVEETNPAPGLLNGVAMLSPTDAVAVGGFDVQSGEGVIIRRQ